MPASGQCWRRRPPWRLVRVAFADIFVNAVGADKTSGAGAVALGVEELRVVVDVGQQGGPALYPVLSCNAVLGQSRAILRLVGTGPRECILQSDRQRRGSTGAGRSAH